MRKIKKKLVYVLYNTYNLIIPWWSREGRTNNIYYLALVRFRITGLFGGDR